MAVHHTRSKRLLREVGLQLAETRTRARISFAQLETLGVQPTEFQRVRRGEASLSTVIKVASALSVLVSISLTESA